MIRMEFVVSHQEAGLIQQRMAEIGTANLSAYLRKQAIDGYIIHLDLSDVRELTKLLRSCSNNLNQYARKANETGSIYAADIEDIRARLDGLWDAANKMLSGLAKVP